MFGDFFFFIYYKLKIPEQVVIFKENFYTNLINSEPYRIFEINKYKK